MPGHEQTRDIAPGVTRWLIEGLSIREGDRVLEIAGGSGLVSFAAAATRRPSVVVCSDVAEPAVRGARHNAASAQLTNWSDLLFLTADMLGFPFRDHAFDAAACRWGFMFASHPELVFREVARVLRSGRRLAFAVGGSPAENPWQSILEEELKAFGLEEGVAEPRRGDMFSDMFSLADEALLQKILESTGFSVVRIEHLPLTRCYRDFDDYWDVEVEDGDERRRLFASLSPVDVLRFRGELMNRLSGFVAAGSYEIPGLVIGVVAAVIPSATKGG